MRASTESEGFGEVLAIWILQTINGCLDLQTLLFGMTHGDGDIKTTFMGTENVASSGQTTPKPSQMATQKQQAEALRAAFNAVNQFLERR